MEEDLYDVIVVGAGAAGLMAAWELAMTGKKTAVIEAKDRAGGRIHTLQIPGFDMPVEAGAEFVHGKLELTALLMKKAGMSQHEVKGEIWQKADGRLEQQKDFIEDYSQLKKKFNELDEDMPVQEFFDRFLQGDENEDLRFSLKNYVEGYYAADISRASTFAMRKELNESSDKQFRIEGGYTPLIDFLMDQCKQKHVSFFFSTPVHEVSWKKDEVKTVSGDNQFFSRQILVTAPVGVLQQGALLFSPAIPGKMESIKKLGFGNVVKILLQFEQAFWKDKKLTAHKDLSELSFVFSDEFIPTWWTAFPKQSAMITGWSGGPHANKLEGLTKNQIIQKSLESLSRIFQIDIAFLEQQLRVSYVANWPSDPFSCGSYSFEVVNGPAIQRDIKEPVEQTIFFAGEGLREGPEIGTVEAALQSGREAAHRMIASFKS